MSQAEGHLAPIPAPVAKLVHADVVRLFLGRLKPTTLRAYRQDLRDLQKHLGASDLDEVARQVLEGGPGPAVALTLDWISDMGERGLAPATVARRLAALRSLIDLARTLCLVTWKLEVKPPKVKRLRDTRGPGREGVEKILDLLAHTPGHRAARNRAVVRLLYDLALRRNEVVTLDVEHVDFQGERVWVLAKGSEQRDAMTLPQETIGSIENWLKLRGPEPGALITSMNPSGVGDGRLTGRSIARIMRELGFQTGVERARPHGVRHAAITEALERTGGDVRAVARFSRHRDLNTLTVYDDNRRDLAGEVARQVAGGIPTEGSPEQPAQGDERDSETIAPPD